MTRNTSVAAQHETKLDNLRAVLAVGETHLDDGNSVDGESFMSELID